MVTLVKALARKRKCGGNSSRAALVKISTIPGSKVNFGGGCFQLIIAELEGEVDSFLDQLQVNIETSFGSEEIGMRQSVPV